MPASSVAIDCVFAAYWKIIPALHAVHYRHCVRGCPIFGLADRYPQETTVLILIILLVLLFGGGGGYYGYSRWGAGGGMGIVGTVLLIVLVLYLLGAVRP